MKINEINITINNIGLITYLHIDCQNLKVMYQGISKDISIDKIYDLLSIIRTWNNKYYQDNIIDSEIFKIEINEGNQIDIYEGQGLYPDNYQNFKEWIGMIIND